MNDPLLARDAIDKDRFEVLEVAGSAEHSDENDLRGQQAQKVYCAACDSYKHAYNSTVMSVLLTQWHTLYLPLKSDMGHALPICDMLSHPDASFIQTVDFGCESRSQATRYRRDGDWVCRLLRRVLRKNQTIKTLRLARLGISESGMRELCAGLRCNRSVETLDLRDNYIEADGAKVLCKLIDSGWSALKLIDVSYNSVGSSVVHQLMHVVQRLENPVREELDSAASDGSADLCHHVPRKVVLLTKGNFETEEIYNSISHGMGLFLTLIGAYWVLGNVWQEAGPMMVTKEVSLSVYFSSLVLMYASSTLMHGFFLLPSVEKIFKILDHLGIYFLIAGSYTPIVAINMSQTTSGVAILILEWSLCGVGSLMYIAGKELDLPGNNSLFDVFELVLYLLMGWAVVLDYDTFTKCTEPYTQNMILAGGLVYSFGVIFFISGNYIPFCHVIWHFFVLIASVLHFFAIKAMVFGTVPEACFSKAASLYGYVADDSQATARALFLHAHG